VSGHRHLSRTPVSGQGADRRTPWRGSVAPVGWGVAESLRAVVAEEIVGGEDVVDLEAVCAGVALAYVALEERVVVDHSTALAVIQSGGGGGLATGLAVGRWRHPPRPPEAVGRRRE